MISRLLKNQLAVILKHSEESNLSSDKKVTFSAVCQQSGIGKQWFHKYLPMTARRFLQFLHPYLKPPRSLRFTNLGKAVVLFSFGIGLSAMNTGNNLLYMIFGMILGFITASGIISEMSLRGLEIDWILEQELYALKPAALRLILRNTKKKFPSFGIEVTMEITHPVPAEHSLPERNGNWSLKAKFLEVAAKSQEYADLIFVPAQRGSYKIARLKIETSFPFGFFRKYFFREAMDNGCPIDNGNGNKEFIVYPQMVPLPQSARSRATDWESQPRTQKGAGDSFWGLKDFVEGDNPRMISWKNSAKSGKMVVRETERETESKLWISLEPLEKWMELNRAELESAVSFTASTVREKFKNGFAVGLYSRALRIFPSKEKKTFYEILKVLALFEPHEESSVTYSLRGAQGRGEEKVEILALWAEFRNDG